MTAITTPATTPATRLSADGSTLRRVGRQTSRPVDPLLHREATPYYLLLGASMLLLVLGIVMVFSASSVIAFSFLGSSFAIVNKQVMWVVIGLPLMWIASRLPVRAWRAFAYLGLIASLALLFLVVFAGTEVNGNRNWLEFGGPFRVQPSELAKFSLVLWGADLLARKQKLLTQWKHLLVPFVPVSVFVIGLVLLGGDLGTAVILVAIMTSLLWVAGAPLRLFVWAAVPTAGVVALMVQTKAERLSRITDWLHPNQADPMGGGFQALHGKFALGLRRLVGCGSRWLQGEVGQPARGAHRLHLRDHRRGARPGRHARRAGSGRRHRLCRAAHRRRRDRAVRPAGRRRRDGVDPGAGPGEHRCGARHPAHHRCAVAAGLLRRVRARTDHARSRHAAVVRPTARPPVAAAARAHASAR